MFYVILKKFPRTSYDFGFFLRAFQVPLKLIFQFKHKGFKYVHELKTVYIYRLQVA